MGNFSLVVLDFETSGLSPAFGDRPIEIGAVLVRNNQIVDRFQSLMNPGFRVSSFIEDYTGINNKMLAGAPRCADVMKKFATFIADHHLAAHNASFDQKFLDAELCHLKLKRQQDFVCTMLVARRVFQDAPNHKLETLVHHAGLLAQGQFHRALADAEMTAQIWLRMIAEIKKQYGLKSIPIEVMQRLAKISKREASAYLLRQAGK